MKTLTVLILFLLATSFSAETPTTSKRNRAKVVLSEFEIPARFDGYLTRGADQVAGGNIRDPKLHKWLQELWIQELGWTKVEDAYLAHFESKFSEAELKELLTLAKNPVVKKLLKEEMAAFQSTFEQRNKTFATFWYRYNNLEFSPPAQTAK